MPRKTASETPRPTDSELAILRVLWAHGPSNVRDVLDGLNEARDEEVGYTTVLRFLQIMMEKGHVKRSEEGRGHRYAAATPAAKMQRRLAHDFMERAFGGSASALVLNVLGGRKVPKADLREIRRLLDGLER